MRENKEKTVTSGDEDAVAPPVVPVTFVQGGKRKSKSISSAMDLEIGRAHRLNSSHSTLSRMPSSA